jgi:signal peptidase I
LLGTVPAYLRAYSMAGGSETPTILLGDKLLVSTAAYRVTLPYTNITVAKIGSPARGDMIRLRFPIREFIGFKRVLGLPGETIEVRDGRVIINGSQLPVRPLRATDFFWVPGKDRLGSFIGLEQDHFVTYTPGLNTNRSCTPVRLNAKQYFLLGDDRDNSWDSRYLGQYPLRESSAR